MKLPKQRNIPWLGALVDSLYTALPILSIINFLSIITLLYATIRGYLFDWAPWLTFGWFIGIMVILTSTLIVLMYIFVVPSIWTFRGKQMYGYESELLNEVKALRKEVQEMKKEEE